MLASIAGIGDVSVYCQSKSWKRRYQRASSASIVVPSLFFAGGEEGLDLTLDTGFVGSIQRIDDNANDDDSFTTFTAYDRLIELPFRQVMDADGDYSDPSIFADFEDAVSIFEAAVDHSQTIDGSFGVSVVTHGTGPPLIGFKPVDWPMTLEELRVLLVGTNTLDVVMNGTTMDLYPGDFGTDLSGSIVLEYDTGAHNCTGAQRSVDLAEAISRLRYFLGPKRPQYDQDIQHWAGDVQKDDPLLPDPPQSTIDSLIAAWEAVNPLRREIRVYDANGDENSLRDFYYYVWQGEMLRRAVPRTLITMVPAAGSGISFDAGDLVGVAAGASVRGGWSGAQRVYEFEATDDVDGNTTVGSIVTSGDQENA